MRDDKLLSLASDNRCEFNRGIMNYSENVLGLIGQTPLVKLNKLTKGIHALVLAKMESHNPGG